MAAAAGRRQGDQSRGSATDVWGGGLLQGPGNVSRTGRNIAILLLRLGAIWDGLALKEAVRKLPGDRW